MFSKPKFQDSKEVKPDLGFDPNIFIYATADGFIKVTKQIAGESEKEMKCTIDAVELDKKGSPILKRGALIKGNIQFDIAGENAYLNHIESNGLGTFLFKLFVESVQDQKYITTSATALTAISFYEKMGLQAVGHISGQPERFSIVGIKYIASGYEFLPMLSDDMKLDENKFYLREREGKTTYSVITPKGEIVKDIPVSLKLESPLDVKKLGDAEKNALLNEASDVHVSIKHRLSGGMYYDDHGKKHEIKGVWESAVQTTLPSGALFTFDTMKGTPSQCKQILEHDRKLQENNGWPLVNIENIIQLKEAAESYYMECKIRLEKIEPSDPESKQNVLMQMTFFKYALEVLKGEETVENFLKYNNESKPLTYFPIEQQVAKKSALKIISTIQVIEQSYKNLLILANSQPFLDSIRPQNLAPRPAMG